MRKIKTEFGESLFNNKDAWYFYAMRLTELSISMFEWVNLPDTVDERFLELTLFKNGNAVFFKDEEIGYLALKCMSNGYFDLYGIPRKRRAWAINSYHKNLNENDSVIIYNNMVHTNSIQPVEYYAKRLWEIDRTIDVNCRAQKTPVLIQCTENQRLSLLNAYQKFDGNEPVIFSDKDFNIDNAIKSLKTDAPYIVDKLYAYKTQLWNEALTYLGISNVSFQKKERMVSDEVTRSQGGTIASRYSRLESRKQACKKINEMFGLNIDVFYRPDYREQDDEFMLDGATGNNDVAEMVVDLRTRSEGGVMK